MGLPCPLTLDQGEAGDGQTLRRHLTSGADLELGLILRVSASLEFVPRVPCLLPLVLGHAIILLEDSFWAACLP